MRKQNTTTDTKHDQMIVRALKINKITGLFASAKLIVWILFVFSTVNFPIFWFKIRFYLDSKSTPTGLWVLFAITSTILIALICQTIYFSYKHLITFSRIIKRFGKSEEELAIIAKHIKKPLLDNDQRTFIEWFALGKNKWWHYTPFLGITNWFGFGGGYAGHGEGMETALYIFIGRKEMLAIREEIKALKESKISADK
ncbi:hypothetical protein [Mycoplasma todarodis]|nr:hypothetical protein [Mycoplasma todarodis]